MSTQDFLIQSLQRGIRLSVHGDKLDIDAPKSALTPDMIEYMRQHKREIIEALTVPHGPCFACGNDTQAMLTRPDGSWDWMCVPCFDRNTFGM